MLKRIEFQTEQGEWAGIFSGPWTEELSELGEATPKPSGSLIHTKFFYTEDGWKHAAEPIYERLEDAMHPVKLRVIEMPEHHGHGVKYKDWCQVAVYEGRND